MVALVYALYMAFSHDPWLGLGLLGVTVVALPACVGVALKLLPHTPMGRRILLSSPSGDEMLPGGSKREWLKQLAGEIGIAKSRMMPSGAIEVAGRTIDAVSEGMPIDAGQAVRVVEVHGMRVIVRLAEESRPEDAGGDARLTQPMDAVVPDPFEDPPT
jgi:membrane-bound serine protease (ClpP class)